MNFTKTEKLSAMNFAAALIIESMFSKPLSGMSSCGNRFLLYRLLGEKEQYRMEDAIIPLLDRRVLPCMPEDFLRSDAVLTFLPDNSGVRVETDRYTLSAFVIPEGNRYRLHVAFRDDKDKIIQERRTKK